jgi:predicted DNA-binding transcriptional regulator YafY
MPAERLVSLLLLLQLGRTWTADELAARLDTSRRSIQRDIKALRAAGVPVAAARGPGGGFRLPGGYRSRLPLSEGEVSALLVGVPAAATALGLDERLLEARLKLIGSLAVEMRERARQAAQVIHVDEPAWFHTGETPRFLHDVAAATVSRRRIVVEYHAGRGGVDSHLLDPLGLVLKAGVWYLVGRAAAETRIYRVSRIAALEPTAEGFSHPRGFDLAAAWAQARDEFESTRPRLDVTIRLHPSELETLRRAVDWSVRPSVGAGHPVAGEERVELILQFERLEFAFADLIKLAGAVEVVAPRELRQRLADAGRSLVATHAESPVGMV